MANNEGKDGKDADGKPSQIPLLVDVVQKKPPPPKRRKKPKQNYSLDLDPDTPKTADLFTLREDLIEPIEDLIEPDDELPSASLEDDAAAAEEPEDGLDEDFPDDPAEEIPQAEEAEVDFAARMSAQFREQADELVDGLVKEYSQEIVRRLREELSSLLKDLDHGDPK